MTLDEEYKGTLAVIAATFCLGINIYLVKVSSFMCDPVVINQDASLMDAVKVMVNNNVNRLPVVNGHKKIVGIIARADIIKALSTNFSK